MIRILKIWAVSGWWHADCFSPFVHFLSWIWGEDKDETLMPKFSTFLGGDTQQTYRLFARSFFFFFSFLKRTKTQRWTRCSGCRSGTEGVHRKILWIIKQETIYVVLCFEADVNWGTSHGIVAVWTTNICHADLRHVATQVFFSFSAILLISPGIPRSTSTNASNTPSTPRGVSHRPVASPGPVLTSDGWIRRQPRGRCGSNPRCLKATQRPEGTRLVSEAVLQPSHGRTRCPLPRFPGSECIRPVSGLRGGAMTFTACPVWSGNGPGDITTTSPPLSWLAEIKSLIYLMCW